MSNIDDATYYLRKVEDYIEELENENEQLREEIQELKEKLEELRNNSPAGLDYIAYREALKEFDKLVLKGFIHPAKAEYMLKQLVHTRNVDKVIATLDPLPHGIVPKLDHSKVIKEY